MSKFKSTKIFDGFSTVFRQFGAIETHCRFLHGYAIEFKVTFEGELDHRNWVWDFGGMKRSKTKIDGMSAKEWMDYMFEHTTFLKMQDDGLIQLRVMKGPTGAEKFAEYIFNKLNDFVFNETQGRVHIAKVEFFENKKNTAIYGE